MKKVAGETRKKRCDAKRFVNMYLRLSLYDYLVEVAHKTDSDLKPTAEAFVSAAIANDDVLDAVAPYFRRDFARVNKLRLGDPERRRIKFDKEGEKERVQIKVDDATHRTLAALQFALDVRCPAHAAQFVLWHACKNQALVDDVMAYLRRKPRDEKTFATPSTSPRQTAPKTPHRNPRQQPPVSLPRLSRT